MFDIFNDIFGKICKPDLQILQLSRDWYNDITNRDNLTMVVAAPSLKSIGLRVDKL